MNPDVSSLALIVVIAVILVVSFCIIVITKHLKDVVSAAGKGEQFTTVSRTQVSSK
jgi:hypothetical protein